MLVLIHVLHDARFSPEMTFLAYLNAVLETVKALISDSRIDSASTQAIITTRLETPVVTLLLYCLLRQLLKDGRPCSWRHRSKLIGRIDESGARDSFCRQILFRPARVV